MKYFLDQEFIEGHHKPFLGKKRHFIELISIGIVAADGREYYAISSEYDYNKANVWVKENVITPLYNHQVPEHMRMGTFDEPIYIQRHNFHKTYGKSIKQIAAEIIEFVYPKHSVTIEGFRGQYSNADLYGYFADYDWVLFCSLFGTMMDLPSGFPMYMRDLKQTLDEKAERIALLKGSSFKDTLDHIKISPFYPKCELEHHALYDAKFNRDLYNYLQKL